MNSTQKIIIQIYAAFIIAVILNFVPSVAMQSLGAILFFVMVIAAYVYRFKAEKESLMHNHMSFLIKSFWISSLFLAIGIFLSINLADHSIINNAVDSVKNGVVPSESQIEAIIMDYTKQNLLIFCATLLPSIIYLMYRCAKGIMLAKNNQSIANPKNWF